MSESSYIFLCMIISICFLVVLDQTFIVSDQPPKHIIEFDVNGTKVMKPFDCQPLSYNNETQTLTCTNGQVISP